MKNTLTILELTKLLEEQINTRITDLHRIGDKAKEAQQKVDDLYMSMAIIWAAELKPAENIIRAQNPELCELFDSLENIYNESRNTKPESELDLGMSISSFDQK